MRRAGQLAARSFSELCHHHLCSVPSESICSHALSSSPTGRFLGWYRWQATLRPEHKLALNEALGGYGARTSWSRRIINTSSSALNGGGQEINGSGDASTQQHHGKQEGTVERSSGEASTSTAVQRSDNIDMSQFWTEDQKRRAALLDTYVNEAFKERPSWVKIAGHIFGITSLIAIVLYLGFVSIPESSPSRKMYKRKWSRIMLERTMRELHYHPEVVRRIGRPMVPHPIPVLIPTSAGIAPVSTIPLAQYFDSKGRRHHQVEFEVEGPLGRARVWGDVWYALDLPMRLHLLPRWHFLFLDFPGESLRIHAPGEQFGGWRREWWQI